jgi:predicted nucleic acid-binding protein
MHRNENYRKYFELIEKKGGFVSELTILEFYHKIFHNGSKEKSDAAIDILLSNTKVIDLSLELIKEAAVFRSDMLKKGRSLSYADSINYVSAKKLKVKLLTGDNDFRGMEQVEFVK